MNKKTFSEMVEILEASYNEKMSKGTSKIYWDMLKNYSDKDIKQATIKCVKQLKYFPKITEIIELIEGNPTDEAELAWIYLKKIIDKEGYYKSVSFPKYPAIGAVIEDMAGSWCEFIDMLTDEEIKWVKINFLRIYPIMKKRGDYPNKLIGRFELDNSDKYTEKVMLENYGKRLDGKKVDRKLIKEKKKNNSPQTDVKNGGN